MMNAVLDVSPAAHGLLQLLLLRQVSGTRHRVARLLDHAGLPLVQPAAAEAVRRRTITEEALDHCMVCFGWSCSGC